MKQLNGISNFDITNFKISTREELEQKSIFELKSYIVKLEEYWQDQLNLAIEINKYNQKLVSFDLTKITRLAQKIVMMKDAKLSELLGYIHELETQIWECKCVIQGWLRN